MRKAVRAGLAAAATKAKLFADHEEREIQRLSANIINHQVYTTRSVRNEFKYFVLSALLLLATRGAKFNPFS